MGFFGGYIFDGSTWHGFDPDSGQNPDIAEPWLSADIHDSDFATVLYEPAGPGSGTAYLGCTPRIYFGDESASAPTDALREAAGLASWLARQRVVSDEAELRELIASFLAADIEDQLPDHDAGPADDDLGGTFVEAKVARFLKAVGLPVPDELPGDV